MHKNTPVVFRAGRRAEKLRLTLKNTPYVVGSPKLFSTSSHPKYSVRIFEMTSSSSPALASGIYGERGLSESGIHGPG